MDKIAAFSEILAQNPEDAFTRYGLAMEYRGRGDNVLALAEFDELHRRNPDYVPAYQMAAQVLIASGKQGEAERRLNAGIDAAQRTGNRHALSEMQGMLDELNERNSFGTDDTAREGQ